MGTAAAGFLCDASVKPEVENVDPDVHFGVPGRLPNQRQRGGHYARGILASRISRGDSSVARSIGRRHSGKLGIIFQNCCRRNRWPVAGDAQGSLRSLRSLRVVRTKGLEPSHLAVPDPKSGASANSATCATAHTLSLILRNLKAVLMAQ